MNKVDINYMYYVNAFSPPIRFVQFVPWFSPQCDSTLMVSLGILLQNMDNEIYVKINNCTVFVLLSKLLPIKQYNTVFENNFIQFVYENSCFDGQRD